MVWKLDTCEDMKGTNVIKQREAIPEIPCLRNMLRRVHYPKFTKT